MKKSLIITGKKKDAKFEIAVLKLVDHKPYEILWTRSSDAHKLSRFNAPKFFEACGTRVKVIVIENVFDQDFINQVASWVNAPYRILELDGETVLTPWFILICSDDYDLEGLHLNTTSFRGRFDIINTEQKNNLFNQ